jgi:hypothetical protein
MPTLVFQRSPPFPWKKRELFTGRNMAQGKKRFQNSNFQISSSSPVGCDLTGISNFKGFLLSCAFEFRDLVSEIAT